MGLGWGKVSKVKLAYGAIALIGLTLIISVLSKSEIDIGHAKLQFKREQHEASLVISKDLDGQFNQIYQSLRTISYLPSVRKKIGRAHV